MRLLLTGAGRKERARLNKAAAPGNLPEGARRYAVLGAAVAALAAVVIVCSVVIAYFGAIHVDDSYISYRYARNLARGEGLVFNPGERVEGYTNLLYVLMLTPAFWFGVDGAAIHAFSVALGIVACFGVIALLMWHLGRSRGRPAALLGAVLFALCPTVWWWNASGMETMWVLLVQVAVWLTVDRLVETEGQAPSSVRPALAGVAEGQAPREDRPPPTGLRRAEAASAAQAGVKGDRSILRWALVSGALMILIRADGFVTMFLVVVYLLLRRRWRYAAYLAAATGIPLAMLVVWRLCYYGYPLPNTYYAKVTGRLAARLYHAKRQVFRSSHMWPYWTAVLAYVVHTIVAWRRGTVAGPAGGSGSPSAVPPVEPGEARTLVWAGPTFPVRLGPFLALGLTVYFFWIGGDCFQERFLLFHVPLAVCALFEMGLGPSGRRDRLGMWAIAALLMIPLFAPRPRLGLRRVFFERDPKHNWADLGEFLGRNEKGKVLAVEAAGKIPYLSDLHIVDMLGICDVHIARRPMQGSFAPGHCKYDPHYVLRRKPDLIAAWLKGPPGGMAWGLKRSLTAPDYALRYLLYMRGTSPPAGRPKIVDVRGMSEDEVAQLLSEGYRYGVLERRTSADANGRLKPPMSPPP